MKQTEDGAPTTGTETRRPVPELTHDEARLLSCYKELLDGFIPLEWFVAVAGEYFNLANPSVLLRGLLDKAVLHSDSFGDENRKGFNLSPQHHEADLTLSVGVNYEATVQKYVRSRKLSLQSKSDPAQLGVRFQKPLGGTMSYEEMSDALKKAIDDGEVQIDEASKTAVIRSNWGGAIARTTLENPDRPLLAEKKRQLGFKGELEKLGYTVKFEG